MTTNGRQFNGYNLNGNIYKFPDGVKDFLDDAFTHATLVKKGKRLLYYNIPASFDIETSSFYAEKSDEKHTEYVKQATMYIWQFGINGHTIYGRTWYEFGMFIEYLVNYAKLNSNCRLIVYVHNLSYEFQFIKNYFKWNDVFSMKTRRPVYAVSGGIEFRCSYYLSNYSLEYIGLNLLQKYKIKKLTGNLDYSLIRHSNTPLSKDELDYAINDVRVVMAYIQEKIESDGSIAEIPLTNTGYVRNHCRKVCFGEMHPDDLDEQRDGMNYKAIIRSLNILSDEEYEQAKRAFMGGFTHANAMYANETLSDLSVNVDEASAYPAQMAYKYFPMSSSIFIGAIDRRDILDQYLKTYCCMFDLYIVNIRPRVLFENILSVSRCEFLDSAPYVSNNGRLVSCEGIFMTTVTELDFEMLEKFYVWDGIYVDNMRIYKRGYLPTRLIMAVLDFYSKKTTLKDVAGKETEYMVSKNMLNSSFGMMVTDIIRDMFEYDSEWTRVSPDIADSIEKYNKSYNRFLFYPWGVWVTAHARHSLFRAILELGEDYVYSDTDSVKGFNMDKHKDWFKKYNTEIKALAIQASARHDIPLEYFMPKTPKGKEKLIGVWEEDPAYVRFKTCGAKRYIYEQRNPENPSQLDLKMTVAGLGKKKALKYLLERFNNDHDKIFDFFENGMYIEPEHTGKLTLTYIDEECSGSVTDYLGTASNYYESSCIHSENAPFEMSLMPQYIDYLGGMKMEVGTFVK